MNIFELVAVIFGIVSVYLSTRQSIWSWPTGIVNVTMYIVVFWQSKLYADMGLQVVYLALSIYGWYEWLYGGKGHTELHVSRTPRRLAILLAVAGAGTAALLGTFLSRHTDASLPHLDATATATSLVAQYLMTRKYVESWLVWIVIDVVYVGMFIYKGLYLTAGLYAVFFALAVAGWRAWRRAYEDEHIQVEATAA